MFFDINILFKQECITLCKKNLANGWQSISWPMRIMHQYKKILLVRQNLPQKKIWKKTFFLRGNFTPFISKSFQIWDHFFPLLFPKYSENLKSLDIGLWEVGAKRHLNGLIKWRRKKSVKNFFCHGNFIPFMSKKF